MHYGGKIKKSQLHFPDEDRQIIKHLMDNGADVFLQVLSLRQYFGFLILLHDEEWLFMNDVALTYFSQTKEHKETVFHYCASEGNVAVLEQVLQNLHQGQIQLAVNKQSVTGWSPLIVSSSKGHLEIVKV